MWAPWTPYYWIALFDAQIKPPAARSEAENELVEHAENMAGLEHGKRRRPFFRRGS